MEKVARAPSVRAWILVALVALLGMTVAAGAGSAAASAPGHAVTAKKKCKKHKRSASSSKKKKKCKKKHNSVVILPAPAPLVRASLSWSAPDEVDLHAFDASGNHAGWNFGVDGVVNNIPSAHHNGDIGPIGGTESFTDDIYVIGGPSNREFSYVACLYDNGSENYVADFTGVTRDGTTTTLHLDGTPSDGPDIYTVSAPGGPAVPNPAAVCGLL
jgi:uncharacterized protein YfaP (DUF2135 family)